MTTENNCPLVSILMTAYNREKYIAEAIESVLSSTYDNLELIIVDDRSRDRTVEIARKYEKQDQRVKVYINEENLGDYPNRNQAAKYASGVYLKYVDADDLLFPDSVRRYVDVMQQHQSCAFALSLPSFSIGDLSYLRMDSKEVFYKFFRYRGVYHCGPSGAIIRKEVFESIGGFSGEQFISDLDLWIRLTLVSDLIVMGGDLVFWRVHEDQQMSLGNSNDEQLVRTIKLTYRYLFSNRIRLGVFKKLSSVYSFFRYLVLKFWLLSKTRNFVYACNVYLRLFK